MNNPINEVLMINKSNKEKIIEKGEVIGKLERHKNSKIIPTNLEKNTAEDILKCYEGPTNLKEKFECEIRNILANTKQNLKTPFYHEIKLTEDNPKSTSHPRRLPQTEKAFLEEHIKELTKDKIIQESKSRISSPIVIVKKRMVGNDYA